MEEINPKKRYTLYRVTKMGWLIYLSSEGIEKSYTSSSTTRKVMKIDEVKEVLKPKKKQLRGLHRSYIMQGKNILEYQRLVREGKLNPKIR